MGIKQYNKAITATAAGGGVAILTMVIQQLAPGWGVEQSAAVAGAIVTVAGALVGLLVYFVPNAASKEQLIERVLQMMLGADVTIDPQTIRIILNYISDVLSSERGE